MSYCRMGFGSDVYLYFDVGGYIKCCFCKLSGDGSSVRLDTFDDAIAHIHKHIEAGHVVPSDVIPSLEADRDADSD